jgi:hypothetical protein
MLIGLAVMAVAVVLLGFLSRIGPGLHGTLTAVTGQGTGHLVAPTSEDQIVRGDGAPMVRRNSAQRCS